MLLGLEPGHRHRDDRLDRRVFATVLAFIGGGLVFLLAVVSLSFPQWIDPRAFVAWLLPSVGGEMRAAAPARPRPVFSASAIGLGFSSGAFGETTDSEAGAVSPPDEAAAGPAAVTDGGLLEQPRPILVQAVQDPMIDSDADLLPRSIVDPGTIVDPGDIMEPGPVVDPAPIVDHAPIDPAPIVDPEPAPGVNLPCAVDPAAECAAPPAPTPPGSPGAPPRKAPPGQAPGGPPGQSNPHPPTAPPGRPPGR